ELADTQVIHQADMIIGIGVPWPIDLKRTGGLATLGVAQIGRDNAKLTLELVEWVERVRREPRDRRVEPATGDHQQREARADLFVMDANLASLIEWHGFFSLSLRYSVRHPRASGDTGETVGTPPPRPAFVDGLTETADYCAAARIGTCTLRKRRTRLIV